MHGTRADITFQNDIYGFGGSAGSSVAQNNMWSFQSDGTWRKVIASSPQSHPRTSWPQMVLSIDPVTGMWDGDTLICVGSNDVPQINSAGYLTVMQYSTSLRMWSSISNTQVRRDAIMALRKCTNLLFPRRFSILPLPVAVIYWHLITGLFTQANLLCSVATTATFFTIKLTY
jgi:hypothetical protein